MTARVFITYKPGVLEPQGQTVCQFLQHRGETKVQDVRIGKLIEFVLDDMPAVEAEALLARISDDILANPVIESYRVEVA